MKNFVTIIGCLAIATSLGLAQTTDTQNNIGAAGVGSTAPGHDPAFHASGGTGHGVGINGGTHTGSVIGSPYGAAGAQNTNSARGQTNAAGWQQNRTQTLHPSPSPHSP